MSDEVAVDLRRVASGFREPVAVAHAGDGTNTLYVVERGGRIQALSSGRNQHLLFLDIADQVGAGDIEQGLLGLAFHPRFRDNGSFFVNYTDRAGNTVIARYRATADRTRAEPSSHETILNIQQPFPNHNGGHLAFGPDGMLWIGTGDGGAGGDPFDNGQDPRTLLGKMLRIDVDRGSPYAVPVGNVPAGTSDERPEIWGLGLRNPWRYSFDRATGDLYIADVGQSGYEEVNFVPAGSPSGLNFGWSRTEGSHCYPPGSTCDRSGFELPIVEYPTGREGCAVTGGDVYRGPTQIALQGTYLYADFCSGTIWGLRRDPEGGWRHWVARAAPGGHAGFSSFGEDEAGELYLTALDTGVMYQVVVTR